MFPIGALLHREFGTDCVGRAIFLADDADGFVRGVLVHIDAYDLRDFAGEQDCCNFPVSPARTNRPGSHHQRDFILQASDLGSSPIKLCPGGYREATTLSNPQNALTDTQVPGSSSA